MVLNIPLVSVSLATICLESVLYGIFLVLFGLSTYLLVTHKLMAKDKNYRKGSRMRTILENPFIVASFFIALGLTAHWLINCIRLFMAFDNSPSGIAPLLFLADLSQHTEVAKTACVIICLLIGDAMIIYRLWIVWGHDNKIILFPIISLLGLAICGTGITVQFSRYKPGQNVFISEAGRWVISDIVFTLCTNLYSTGRTIICYPFSVLFAEILKVAISWRIWRINQSVRAIGSSDLSSVLGIIVESAFIYTAWSAFFFASYLAQSNLQFVGVDCLAPMSAIAFMLINVRVGLGWAQKATSSSLISGSQSISSSAKRTRGAHFNGHADNYPLRPVEISIQQAVEDNRDDQYSGHDKASKIIV